MIHMSNFIRNLKKLWTAKIRLGGKWMIQKHLVFFFVFIPFRFETTKAVERIVFAQLPVGLKS